MGSENADVLVGEDEGASLFNLEYRVFLTPLSCFTYIHA